MKDKEWKSDIKSINASEERIRDIEWKENSRYHKKRVLITLRMLICSRMSFQPEQ